MCVVCVQSLFVLWQRLAEPTTQIYTLTKQQQQQNTPQSPQTAVSRANSISLRRVDLQAHTHNQTRTAGEPMTASADFPLFSADTGRNGHRARRESRPTSWSRTSRKSRGSYTPVCTRVRMSFFFVRRALHMCTRSNMLFDPQIHAVSYIFYSKANTNTHTSLYRI